MKLRELWTVFGQSKEKIFVLDHKIMSYKAVGVGFNVWWIKFIALGWHFSAPCKLSKISQRQTSLKKQCLSGDFVYFLAFKILYEQYDDKNIMLAHFQLKLSGGSDPFPPVISAVEMSI